MIKKRKISNFYTLLDSYNDFIKKHPEGSFYHVSKQEYYDITQAYLKAVAEQIIEKSLPVRLPFSFGVLCVNKVKRRINKDTKPPVDWVMSKKLGKRVYLTNEHSSGFVYKFGWDKGLLLNNFKLYKFKPSRTNARRVAYLVKNKQNDYFLSKF